MMNNFRLSSPQLRSSSLSLRRLGKASDFIRKILPSRSRIRISCGFLHLASLASRTNDANESALSFQPDCEWSDWDERHGRLRREVAVERSGSCRDTMER